jgi:uncharacterized protein YcfL
MKKILILVSLLLFGCDSHSRILSYEELVNYPSHCSKAKEQLAELRFIQRIKNFSQDPDSLNEADRAYNSRLKSTIWWYTWKCGIE